MRSGTTSLSLQSDEPRETTRGTGRSLVLLVLLLLLTAVGGLGYLGYQMLQRTDAMEQRVATLSARSDESAALARQAMERAVAAEAAAKAAAEGRQQAEAQTADAHKEADAAVAAALKSVKGIGDGAAAPLSGAKALEAKFLFRE